MREFFISNWRNLQKYRRHIWITFLFVMQVIVEKKIIQLQSFVGLKKPIISADDAAIGLLRLASFCMERTEGREASADAILKKVCAKEAYSFSPFHHGRTLNYNLNAWKQWNTKGHL